MKRSEDGLQDAFGVLQDFVIPEAQNAPTLLQQKGVTYDVSPTVGMLAAIAFDREPLFKTGEVENVRIDWKLPADLESTEAAVAQLGPQPLFRLGHPNA